MWKLIKKIFKLLYGSWGETFRMIGFLIAAAAFVSALQLFIVYPVQVLTTIVVATGLWILLVFFSEIGK